MKKALYLSALLAAALVSCSKAETDITTPENILQEETVTRPVHPVVTLSATLPSTKAVFTENDGFLKVEWSEDDKILIVNKTGGKIGGILTAAAVEGSSADFSGELDAEEGDVLVAYFGKGVTEGETAYSADGVHFDFSNQGGDLDYCQYYAPMYATVTYSETGANTLAFTNLASIVRTRVKVPAALDVAYIELSSDKNLLPHSGTISLDGTWTFAEDDFGPVVAAHEETVSDDASDPAYIIVPAQTLDDYLTVSAFDGKYGTYCTAAAPDTDSEKGYFATVKNATTTFEPSSLQTLNKVLTGYVGSAANIDYANCSVWKIHGTEVTLVGNPANLDNLHGTLYYALQSTQKDIELILSDEMAISRQGFYACNQLISLSAPKVTSLALNSIRACSSLASVDLPNVTTVSEVAFMDCSALEEITLPSVETVADRAFWNCSALKTVSFPVATQLDYGVFMNCSSLEKVSLPAAEVLDMHVFLNCENLSTISLPAATTLGDGVFSGCTSLESASLPVATTLGNSLFNSCSSLKSFDLSPEVEIIPQGFFYGCSALTDEAVKDFCAQVTSVGITAFTQCSNITALSFPQIITVSPSAFIHNENLSSLTFGQVLTKCGSGFVNPSTNIELHLNVNQGSVSTWSQSDGTIIDTGEAETTVAGGNGTFAGLTFKTVYLDQ